jgi:two-component system cell cycle sensor histidine kinase/response regulator CckA
MQNAFIEEIVLLHAAFAGVFFFLSWNHPNRFARLFAWSWTIEAIRAAILLPAVHNTGGWPLPWFSVADVLCVAATWCLLAGFADIAGVRLPRWLGPVYFWVSAPTLLLTRYVVQPLVHARMGVPLASVDFAVGFFNQLVLFIPVSAARIAIFIWLWELWKRSRIPGALVATIFAVPYAAFAMAAPIQNYFSYQPDWIAYFWSFRVLGFSVGMVILMFDRQNAAVVASEASMAAAQELAHLGSWELDLRLSRGNWSEEMSRLHGHNHALGAPTFEEFLNTIHPMDREKVVGVHGRISEAQGPVTHEYRTNPSHGPVRFLSSTFDVVRDSRGRPERLVGNSLDITERKETELALLANEKRYRALFEKSPLPKWVFDLGTLRIIDVNERALAHYGYSRDEFLAMTTRDLVPPGDRDAAAAGAGPPGNGKADSGGCKHRKRDGTIIDVVVYSHDVDVGVQRARMVVAQDITAQKKAEQALRNAEEQYRTIFENALEGIYRSTPEGRFLAVNPMMAQILGFSSPEELVRERTDIGRQGYVDPRRREEFRRQIETHGVVNAFEYAARRRDGSGAWVSENAHAVRDARGTVVYYEGTLVDITARKIAEEALRQARGQLERVLSASPTVVYSLAVDGQSFTPTYFSDNLKSMLGYEARDTLAANWWLDNLHPDDRDHVFASVARLMADGHAAQDYRFRNKSGRYLWLRDEQRLLKDADDRPSEVVGSWTDVTERVNLEAQLRQSQKMEAIGQLAGGVAHDFNNLLTVIKGYSQMLLADDMRTPDSRELLQEIFAASARASQLTNQLLSFSRKQAMQLRNLSLNEMVAELGKMLQRLIGENVTLRLDSAPDVPTVRGDSTMLEQLVMNLAINARDAMPDGGGLTITTGRVKIGAGIGSSNPLSYPGEFATLEVRDTGSGMTPEVLAHIFEPFFTTKGPVKGTGLGLATVYGIVHQHKGWIDVDSEVGKGSSFLVFLPAAPAAGAVDAPDEESAPGHVPTGTETILLVEDETAVRQLARLVLQRIGYRVFEAGSSPAAMAMWRQHGADIAILVTDVILPEGPSGIQLAQELCAERPGLKVVYTSGFVGAAAQQGPALQSGVNFLPKPYLPNALAHIVRRCLDSPA